MTAETQTIAVTGAGSGIGRAVALKFAAGGWKVALIGRRAGALEETAALAAPADGGGRVECFPCDISDAASVEKMAKEIAGRLGDPDALVNAAGVNTKLRALDVLSLDDYTRLLGTNLHGAFYCARAFLPAMRRRGSGTIVNINSEAGRAASPKAGPAYVMSKFGLAGLTQAINAEERARGIRACSIFPGDVNTPLLDQRPQPPSAEARQQMTQPEDVAACVWLAVTLPSRAIIEELVVRPR